jgi:uncharacterized protein
VDNALPPGSAEMPRRERPVITILSLLLVFAPVAVAMLRAAATGMDALALAAVPLSCLLAWLALRLRGLGWSDLGLRRGVSLLRLLITVPLATVTLLLLTVVLGSLLAWATGLQPDLSHFAYLRGNLPALLGWLLIVWTVAAFGEEMLLRGFLLNALLDLLRSRAGHAGAWALALMLTAIVTGAAHAYQGIAGVVLSGLIGLGFSLVYLATRRNLWAPILTHGLYDTVGFLVLFANLAATASADAA